MAQPHAVQRITRSACHSLPESFSLSLGSNRAASEKLHSSQSHSSLTIPPNKKKNELNYSSQKKHGSKSINPASSKSSKSSKWVCITVEARTRNKFHRKAKMEELQGPFKTVEVRKISDIGCIGKEGIKSEKRVAANSSVNFAHLTDKEQVLRYKNMLKEYYQLKQLVHTKVKEMPDKLEPVLQRPERTKEEKALLAAQKKIKQGVYEIQDSNELMENLASLLANKKMKGDSLEFGLIVALVRKVMNKLKKGDKNLVGRTQRRYFKVASKEGLIEYFTGIRLDHDEELKSSVLGFKSEPEQVKQGRGAPSVPKSSDRLSIPSSFQVPPPVQSHANAEIKLNAAMLRQFNLDHPTQKWG